MTVVPPGDHVLVVGAAHIDVMADYEAAAAQRVDKAGLVRYSVGGTAYNIAVDLGQVGIPTMLMTVLKQPSFSSVWIRERLEAANVGTQFVELSEHVAESGFVALRRAGVMESAVTHSAVEHHTFRRDRLEKAIAAARIVVLECNLAPEQITLVAQLAQRAGRPVVVAAVSDTKVRRIGQTLSDVPFDLVSMNALEAQAIGIDIETLVAGPAATALCAKMRARQVVVTCSEHGHRRVDASGKIESFAAPDIDGVVSPTGAGDALLAGIVAHAFRHGLDVSAAKSTADLLVRKVLGQAGATSGSLAVDADYARLARIAMREGPWINRFLTAEVGVAATVVIGLVALVPALLQVWYAKHADDIATAGAIAAFNAASAVAIPAASAPMAPVATASASTPASPASSASSASALR